MLADWAGGACGGFRTYPQKFLTCNQRSLCLYQESSLPRLGADGTWICDCGTQLVDRDGNPVDKDGNPVLSLGKVKVEKLLSKFTVTLEYINLVPAAQPPAP